MIEIASRGSDRRLEAIVPSMAGRAFNAVPAFIVSFDHYLNIGVL